jgi:hypothetical protein
MNSRITILDEYPQPTAEEQQVYAEAMERLQQNPYYHAVCGKWHPTSTDIPNTPPQPNPEYYIPMTKLINLTPHAINLCSTLPATTIPSSGVARVSVTHSEFGKASFEGGSVPLVCGNYGEVTGLPDPAPDTLYIVSAMVRAALPARMDLASPARLVRDDAGTVIGCEALEMG